MYVYNEIYICINVYAFRARTKSYHVPLKSLNPTKISTPPPPPPTPTPLKKKERPKKQIEIFYVLYEYLVFTSLYVTTVGVYKTKQKKNESREIVHGVND